MGNYRMASPTRVEIHSGVEVEVARGHFGGSDEVVITSLVLTDKTDDTKLKVFLDEEEVGRLVAALTRPVARRDL